MDATKTTTNPNPREKANFLSVLFWTWTLKLFRIGYSKILEPEDLFDPIKIDRSSVLGDRLEKQWNLELENTKKLKRRPNFLKTIFRCFAWEYLMFGILHTFNEFILRLGTPLLLGKLLRHFRGTGDSYYNDALMYAGGICLATGINAITLNQSIFGAFHLGGKIRIAVCSVVYRKALRLSTTALGETAPGKIVNLVANDVNRFDLVSIFLHHMWSAPLTTIIIGYFLYTEAGYAGILGIGAVFIVVPIQSYTGKLSSKFRLQTAIKTDERVRLMDEIISGVQVIKMYAWEKPFCTMIALARKLELKVVQKNSWIRGIFMTFNLFTTRVAIYCTLVGMLFFGQQITAEKAFVFSSLFNILAHTMSAMFVRGIAEIAECIVAVRRLQYFLMYDEVENINRTVYSGRLSVDHGNISVNNKLSSSTKSDLPYIDDESNDVTSDTINTKLIRDNEPTSVPQNKHQSDKNKSWAVKLTNVTTKWEPSNPENTLQDINFKLERGKLYVIIGAVGAGKSSLLSAILGELPLMQGSVELKGGLSYAAQEAWVFGSTVRQNIIFGEPYDRQRYQRVVKACALLSDFKQFPQGDQTIVGERGSSLSGGQKARINLARAVYRQVDIYIFDDPLSAVDTHVGKHLFEECIQYYLAGKTRILATHQLQYIKSVDGILLMEHGTVRLFANYMDLLATCPDYSTLLASDSTSENDDLLSLSAEKISIRRQWSSTSNRSRTPDQSGGDTDVEDDEEENEVINNIEGTSRGVIKGSIFMKYFRSGVNICFVIMVGILFLLTQGAASLNDYFVQILVNEEETRYVEHLTKSSNNTDEPAVNQSDITPAFPYVYAYTGIVLSVFVIGITRSLSFYALCVKASQRLHDWSFEALIRTSMRFFDTNPSGRILNRFSKDMGAIDELLPKALLDAGQIIMMMVGSLVIVCVVNPIFIVPLVIIAFIFYWIRKVYLKTSKNVKRLEGMMRSPVFTHLNTTLNGLSTIRAYGAQNILKKEFDNFQDSHSSSWYMFISTSTAFGFSLDLFCFLFTAIVTFSFVLIDMGISGAEVGLAITTVMSMTGMIQWGMRQGAEVTNQLMSVERVLEYTLLPPEDNVFDEKQMLKKTKAKTSKKKGILVEEKIVSHSPESWPTEGCIKFHHVYLRYVEEDPPVLKGLNIVIKAKEKVGIVGRTGAGKSSLISALFRLAKVEGVIEIDGIDTGSIYLEDLRRNISIIPQDPVLFSGTLRKNLDPFNEFKDEALWSALEEVELKDSFAMVNGLDSRVFDRGTNFSAGQRQLVCLARAILRNNKVLMLDEATANVDPHTDGLIQRTIRTKFSECTVLTVAHRLNTIMDSDKVLVMDKGRMVEFDHPYILLKNDHGHFTSLVKQTGRAMTVQLMRISKQAYDDKLNG
ncbi:probable multidrug resistance-associated protein lethal(2)03659 isoform X2 [Cotesia glomerata]|uniref:probable multidrug resistance-associated protein lethal(2)03659 isoform X2 n=1 Tax=Cotesia glomerata TaxID=32391 RepID=UPI001D009B1A|nr:probable multidrug resistance-associated protein lethal(2)03659 isoform X2 [Cotesia glomerata]